MWARSGGGCVVVVVAIILRVVLVVILVLFTIVIAVVAVVDVVAGDRDTGGGVRSGCGSVSQVLNRSRQRRQRRCVLRRRPSRRRMRGAGRSIGPEVRGAYGKRKRASVSMPGHFEILHGHSARGVVERSAAFLRGQLETHEI